MKRAAGVVAGYVLLALVATWPLALHFGTHSPGSDVWHGRRIFFETPVNLWNLWWFRHALVDLGRSPFYCDLVFHPHGANLWFHTLAPVHGLIGLVLQPWLSLAAAQNVVILFDLTAAGVGAYGLARHLGLPSSGACLAGALFAFSPAVFAHLYAGHFELLATFWLPAALLAFLRLADAPDPRLRDGAALGLVFVGAAYTCQYYAVYAAELVAVAALVRRRKVARRALAGPLALAAALALAGLAPFLRAFAGAAGSLPVSAAGFDWFSGDLASYVVPGFTHPLLSRLFEGVYARLNPGLFLPQETTMFLGWTAAGLAAFGVVARRRAGETVALPLAIAVVFGILSLGSHLKVAGLNTSVPLPAALLEALPLLRLARAPGRHVVLAMLGLGLLAGWGWQSIRRPALRYTLPALMAFEYAAVPLPLFPTRVPEAYRRLAAEPGAFAIFEIPFGVRDGTAVLGRPDSSQVFGQTVHGRPILTGVVSHLPDRTWAAIVSTPVIGTLLHPVGATAEAFERDAREGQAYFKKWRIGAVVVHTAARGGPEQRYLEGVVPIARREDLADGSQILWLASE